MSSSQGAHIVLIDINQKEAQRVENLLHKKKFYIDLITTDVCDSKDVNKAINAIAKKYKKIDILVNAVGGFDKLDSIEDINDQEWLKVIDLNLNSAFYCKRELFSIMKKMDLGELLIFHQELASHQIRTRHHISHMVQQRLVY